MPLPNRFFTANFKTYSRTTRAKLINYSLSHTFPCDGVGKQVMYKMKHAVVGLAPAGALQAPRRHHAPAPGARRGQTMRPESN